MCMDDETLEKLTNIFVSESFPLEENSIPAKHIQIAWTQTICIPCTFAVERALAQFDDTISIF